jgi:hypothetical protein
MNINYWRSNHKLAEQGIGGLCGFLKAQAQPFFV